MIKFSYFYTVFLNIQCNGLRGAQSHRYILYSSSCVYSSGNMEEEQAERLEEPEYQEVCCETVSWKWLHKQNQNNGVINRHVIMERENFAGSYPDTKNYRQLMTARRRISLSQEYAPYWLSNTQWSALKPYMHKQQKQTQQAVLTYICICIYVTIIMNGHMKVTGRAQGEKVKVRSDKFYFNQHIFLKKNDLLVSSFTKQDELTLSNIGNIFWLLFIPVQQRHVDGLCQHHGQQSPAEC